jgi:VIT1/CCC1 family predicted Fe2+/Mn2+ transporter
MITPRTVPAVPRREFARPVIFGVGDGMVSLLGTVWYLSGHPALVLPAAISGGVTSAVSMAGFDALSDSTRSVAESCTLGAATGLGCMLPALPYGVFHGPAAVAASAVVCVALAVVIALIRPNRGRVLSLVEVLGVVALAFGAVITCGLFLPGGTA